MYAQTTECMSGADGGFSEVGQIIYATRFAKKGFIYAIDFATLMRRNFICGSAMKLKFTFTLV